MRTLLAIVVLGALAWSGYWYFSATARHRAVDTWLAERRATGWVAEADGVRVTGFPNRVDTIVTGLDLADPKSGWSWHADEFQVLSLSWRPNQVIAVWPGEQVIASPYTTVRASAAKLDGSVVLEPNRRLALRRSTIEIKDLQLKGDSGWTASVGSALLSTRQSEADTTPYAYDLSLKTEHLVLPEGWMSGIDRGGVLPGAIDATNLDAILVFDRPWDRAAVEGENPALRQLRLNEVRLTWGKLDLSGTGTLGVDDDGLAKGKIQVRARNWRQMLDLAVSVGVLSPAVAGATRSTLNLLARMGGDPDTLSVPLDFNNGLARLGPIVLGSAPRLSRR